MLNVSLVYEYSGPEAMSEQARHDADYQSWRTSLAQMAGHLAPALPGTDAPDPVAGQN